MSRLRGANPQKCECTLSLSPSFREARRSAWAPVRRIIELAILFYQFLVVYKRLIPGMKAAAAAFAAASFFHP